MSKCYSVARGIQRRYSQIHFSENYDGSVLLKPRLRDFRNATVNFFLLSSAVFMGYNALWYKLEYEQVQKQVEAESVRLEVEMQRALEAAKKELPAQKGWLSSLAFWR